MAGNGPATTAQRPWIAAIGDPERYPDGPNHKGCVGGRTDLRTGGGQTGTVARIWAEPRYVAAKERQSFFGGVVSRRPEPPDDIGLLLLTRAQPYRPLPVAIDIGTGR